MHRGGMGGHAPVRQASAAVPGTLREDDGCCVWLSEGQSPVLWPGEGTLFVAHTTLCLGSLGLLASLFKEKEKAQ